MLATSKYWPHSMYDDVSKIEHWFKKRKENNYEGEKTEYLMPVY